MAAFRNEVECPRCHRYIPRRHMERWALYIRSVGGGAVRVCHRCWTEVDVSESEVIDGFDAKGGDVIVAKGQFDADREG